MRPRGHNVRLVLFADRLVAADSLQRHLSSDLRGMNLLVETTFSLVRLAIAREVVLRIPILLGSSAPASK